MNECLKLHKVMSEAEVEYNQKFNELKRFDDELLLSGIITDPEKLTQERDKLEAEVKAAFKKQEAARKVYSERCNLYL